MPTVSIVVPSYKQGRYIRATLDSVLSQDYRDLECIVIDGGSTDETVDVLRSIEDPRLTWVSEPDRGQSHAINKGMLQASGQYLSYLNSDDVLRPGAVAAIVAFLESHPQADLVYGDMEHIDAQGNVFHTVIGGPFNLAELLAGGKTVNQAGTFWRRSVQDDIGLFDEDLHFSMDLDYWIRAMLKGKTIAYEPGIRSAFRYHDESKTVSQMVGWLQEWDLLYGRLFEEYADDPVMTRFLRECRAKYSWNYASYFWKQGHVSDVKPLLRRVIREHPDPGRRAASILIVMDAALGTNFARSLQRAFRSLRGMEQDRW